MRVRRKRRKRGGALAHLLGLVGLACLGVSTAGLLGVWDGEQEPASGVVALASYYPLEVGRYWVYRREDPATGTITEMERRIVRRESRPDQELFYFADGMVAFVQEGKVFEMGPEGGVNVVPVDAEPYVYRSQGLHIEKRIGARDTILVLDGRRYEDCLQIITHFRRADGSGDLSMAYASYYAPGVGLVGRELWPRQGDSGPAEILRDYGPRKL